MCLNLPDNCPCNSDIWRCEDISHPVLFWVLGGWFWSSSCSTRQIDDSVLSCRDYCIWHNLILTYDTKMLYIPISSNSYIRDAWAYIYTTNCGNVVTYIKSSVNQIFSLVFALNIPNIKSYDSYVQLEEYPNDF